MTTTPDFRELCAKLVKRLDELNCNFDIPSQSALIECALDALATPPPEPPTMMQILELSGEIEDAGLGQIDLVRAALERWGRA
jgi:hypothetical protein